MIEIEVQNPCAYQSVPDLGDLRAWVKVAMQKAMPKTVHKAKQDASLVIRIVDEAESQQLNNTYRHKNKPTNVLSFPFEAPDVSGLTAELSAEIAQQAGHLGDLVLCEPVIMQEAQEQQKSPRAHWAHMVVHGTLHLQGFDHLNDADADIMESLEVNILHELGFQNPYEPQPFNSNN